MLKINLKNNKGFSLLFAVFISTLVLVVGASIISVSLRQLKLSGLARDSQFAFYAANTGIECAMYWDLRESYANDPVFISSNSQTPRDSSAPDAGAITCARLFFIDEDADNCDDPIDENNTWCVDSDAEEATSYFRLKEFQDVDYCVDVLVKKEKITIPKERIKTTIEARGYNTCDNSNPNRLERGLRVIY